MFFTSEDRILLFHFYLDKNEVTMMPAAVGDLVHNLTGVAANHTVDVHPGEAPLFSTVLTLTSSYLSSAYASASVNKVERERVKVSFW